VGIFLFLIPEVEIEVSFGNTGSRKPIVDLNVLKEF